MKQSIIKALKEAGRGIVLAVIPVILLGVNAQDGTFTVQWNLVIATAIVAGLRFIDKLLHEEGVEKGLTLF